jgi:putative DNA primase/helicase
MNQMDDMLKGAKASNFNMRAIRWFWPDRFAIGKLGLIGGLPDKGKGLVSADMIGRATTGHQWPCGEGVAPHGNVIWFTAEDDIEDTVVPRLIAAGADLDRVHIMEMMETADGERMFNLATDLPALEAKIDEVGGVVLVVIDPVSAYLGVGKINNSSTADVRGGLGPLTKLAERKKVALICVMHFNKKCDVTNAMLRIADSLAYVAAARHVFVTLDDPENKNAHLFVKAKNNLAAADRHALRYGIRAKVVGHDAELGEDIVAPYVVWDDRHVEITATEAMEAADKSIGVLKVAVDFLAEQLADGPVLKLDIEEAAKANGISPATLRRAQSKLGVSATKEKKAAGQWYWSLPGMMMAA